MAAAALLACAIASAEPVPVPRLTIPKCSAPPTVDGKIAEGEWAQAAAVTGFLHHQTGQMTERQPVAWLTYDDQNLYIAVRSPISEGTKLKRACRERDALRLCADDVIEVFVNPQPGQKAESFYQFLGNSIGMILDFEHQPPIGRTVAAWNGQWDFKCATTKEHWDAELAVPLSDVKIPSSADGTRVGLNLCRDWQNPSLTFTCWSLAQTFADTSRMAEVTLGGSCPAVQLLDVTGLLQNRASVRLAVASTGGPELLTAEMEVKLLQTREVIFTDKKEIGLAAGERKAVWFDGKLGAKGKKLMRVTVAAKEGGRTYYEAIIPFTDGARDGILAGKQRAFEVYAGLYPSKNLLKVEADILDYDRAREVKAVGVEVRPEGSALVIASGVIEKFELGHGLVDGLKLPELAAGKYRVTFRATGEAGKQLAVEETEFEKRTFPWFKEKAGVTDEVIPPFTPLMVKGTTVNCWGREHMFGDNGLLEALATRGAQILRSPVRLAGKAEGRELVWRPRGPLKVAEAKPHVARLAGFSIADDLRAEVKTEVEFDGLMKVHVKVSPDREMDLESLRLEVPLNDENALLYHAVGDTIRMTNQAGELPKGTGRIWSSASIQNMVVRGSFIPYLWIGDHDRGLCWMAESDRGWTTDPSVGCLELTSEKNVVTLVVNLVAAKRVLREPVEFAFALQATPVKPLPLGWRTWRSPILAGDGRPMHVIADKSLAWQGYGRPQQPEALKRRIADLMESEPNAIVQPAVSPNDLWGGEEGRYFAAEWSPGCPLILRNDFQTWHFERAVRDFGVNGAYSDSTGPVACRNVLSGCGYVRDDNVQAGFNLLGNRDFHRRLAAILHQHRTGGRLTVNTTDAMVIPCFSFADSSVDGEDARPLTGGRDYLDGWRLDMVRARMMGRQWGLVSEWLPTGAPEASWGPGADDLRVTRSLLALTLLHDVLVHWNHRMDPDEVAKTDFVKKEFGIGESDVEFVGYWDKQAQSSDANVLVSFWRRLGRMLVVAANVGRQDAEVEIRLDLGKAGIHGNAQCVDGFGREALPMRDGRISLKVPWHDFRLLLIGTEGAFRVGRDEPGKWLPRPPQVIRELSDDFNAPELASVWQKDISPNAKGGLAIRDGRLKVRSVHYKFCHVQKPLRVDNVNVQCRIEAKPTGLSDEYGAGFALWWSRGNYVFASPGQHHGKFFYKSVVNGKRKDERGGDISKQGWYRVNWVRIGLSEGKIKFYGSADGVTWTRDWTLDRPKELSGPPKLLILGTGNETGKDPYARPDLNNDWEREYVGQPSCWYVDDLVVGRWE